MQYSDEDIYIYVAINNDGSIRKRSNISYRDVNRKWSKEHKEQNRIYNKRLYNKNTEAILNQRRKYKQSPAGKATKRKGNAKRRQLGYNPMNKPFDNFNGHHLNNEDILFIPSSLHRSISHSVLQDRNMKEINDIAFEWLCTQESL